MVIKKFLRAKAGLVLEAKSPLKTKIYAKKALCFRKREQKDFLIF